MKISVLASGSTGNATYIETPKSKVLVDAGLSGKKIEELMNSIGRTLKDVDSLLVTHEHSDHIKGVGVLARRYGMNIYANQGTWDAMSAKIGKVPLEQKHIFDMGKTLKVLVYHTMPLNLNFMSYITENLHLRLLQILAMSQIV